VELEVDIEADLGVAADMEPDCFDPVDFVELEIGCVDFVDLDFERIVDLEIDVDLENVTQRSVKVEWVLETF